MRRLFSIVIIAICALTAGAQSWDYILHFNAIRTSSNEKILATSTVEIARNGLIRVNYGNRHPETVLRFTSADYDSEWDNSVISHPILDEWVKLKDAAGVKVCTFHNNTFKLASESLTLTDLAANDVNKLNEIRRLAQDGTFFSTAKTNIIDNFTSLICVYDGGYFIRDGEAWYEYRPADRPEGVWNTYTSYGDEPNYYNISNSQATVSIPKTTVNDIYIYKNGEWQKIYDVEQIFDYCPVQGNKFFFHSFGYFFKDGNLWSEYMADDGTTEFCASYEQYDSDSGFYYIKNEVAYVAIPRVPENKFYYMLRTDDTWQEVYLPTQIFDY